MANIGQTQILLLVGICWVPVIILGIFGFALVLRREKRPKAISFASTPPIRLGTLQLERDGQPYEIGFQWQNGVFVASDGQTMLPSVIAELDAAGRVQWASQQQQAWFRQRFVEGSPGPQEPGVPATPGVADAPTTPES